MSQKQEIKSNPKYIRNLNFSDTSQKNIWSGTTTNLPKNKTGTRELVIPPTIPEILSVTTKIHSFNKPVFITLPGHKMYTLIGKTPTKRIPEISSNTIEIHIIGDKEIGYSLPPQDSEEVDYGILFDTHDSAFLQSNTVFVVCGKKFGTRKLDVLASILLKLNTSKIVVQKYFFNKDNKNVQWISNYNKKITKLEHYIDKFLRTNEQ